MFEKSKYFFLSKCWQKICCQGEEQSQSGSRAFDQKRVNLPYAGAMKQETPNSDEVAIPPCLVRPGPRDVNGDEKKMAIQTVDSTLIR